MPVHAVALERHVVGADIAFLEHADLETAEIRDLARHAVDRAAVAEHQHHVDIALGDHAPEEIGPLVEGAAEIQPVEGIEQQVTAVEVDLADLGPDPAQIAREAVEEGADRGLQQENTLAAKGFQAGGYHADPRGTLTQYPRRREVYLYREG